MDLTSYEVYATREEGIRLEHTTCQDKFVREWDIADIDDSPTISSILTAATQHSVECHAKTKSGPMSVVQA